MWTSSAFDDRIVTSADSSADEQRAQIGISFSPAGLLTPFHLGAAEQLKEFGLLTEHTALSGSSGGALAAVCASLDFPLKTSMHACYKVGKQCRDHGPIGTLRTALDEALDEVFPQNAHEIIRRRPGVTTVAYTKLTPWMQPQFIQDFYSKSDLIEVLRASCNVPLYFNGNSVGVPVRGSVGVDGLFTTPMSRVGCPKTYATDMEFIIIPFSQSVGLNPEKTREPDCTARYEIISPDLLVGEQWPFSVRDMLSMGMAAPRSKWNPGETISDEELEFVYDQLCEAGRQAVKNWYNLNCTRSTTVNPVSSPIQQADRLQVNSSNSADSDSSTGRIDDSDDEENDRIDCTGEESGLRSPPTAVTV